MPIFTLISTYCRSSGTKTWFLPNFVIWQLMYPPSSNQGEIWHTRVDPQSSLTCQILSESVYSFTVGGDKPQIWLYFQIHQSVVAPPGGLQIVEHGYASKNFPLSNDIKIVSKFKWLKARSHSQTWLLKSVTDKQKTNTQVFRPSSAACEVQAPPLPNMV